MLKILIIDDRLETREHLREVIEQSLPAGVNVSVEDAFPLDDLDGYASHIRENEVSAILFDEKLNETKNPETGKYASYLGHEIVDSLRMCLPDFPVYVVTAYAPEADLSRKEAMFEDVVDRGEFQRNPIKYTNRILRAAARFQESMDQHLASLSELTLKAAQGELSEEENSRLISIREILGLPFTATSHLVVSDLIAEARKLTSESEGLIQRIKAKRQK